MSKIKQCYNVKPSTYHFYVKMKILVDFHICISVALQTDHKREASIFAWRKQNRPSILIILILLFSSHYICIDSRKGTSNNLFIT